jgi:hypothetical protein
MYLFVINELRLEPKFREAGRTHFLFCGINPVIENYIFVINTMKNTAGAISAYKCVFCIEEPRPTVPSKFFWVQNIIWSLPSDRENSSYGPPSVRGVH